MRTKTDGNFALCGCNNHAEVAGNLRENVAKLHVAIHGGRLVDHDTDYGALFERIDDRFPDRFVWLTMVEDEPIGTLTFRSPRFVEDKA